MSEVYQKTVADHLAKWEKRKSRRPEQEVLAAALVLLRLDLEPLRPELERLYADSHRGRKPFDPVPMLRALLLMMALGEDRLTAFANNLRQKPRLAILAGFDLRRTPAVGTFYLFIDRLEDGPPEPKCPHRVRPSDIRKRPLLRNLSQEKAEKERIRAEILGQADSLTSHLKDQLLARGEQPRPQDFLARLEDLLFKTAVIPSARRGLLGDPDSINVCGDGSALVSGASHTGKPSCLCRGQGVFRCDHPRFHLDHTANWGWDSYRETYYFGHTFYQHIVNFGGHDLPVHVHLGQASESDFTLSVKSLDRLRKTIAEHELALRIRAAMYDAGHDGIGNYEYLLACDILPVIALNSHHKSAQSAGEPTVNAAGVPLCAAGLPMRRHSTTPDHRIVFNCPVKRPTHLEGKTVWKSHPDQCPQKVLCQPETLMGPTVYVNAASNPRLYPRIARDSPQFKELMKLRSGCERSNSVKKVAHKLERRPCRSGTHYLVRLYLISIIEHAKAWVAEDRKVLGDDFARLIDLDQIKALAKA